MENLNYNKRLLQTQKTELQAIESEIASLTKQLESKTIARDFKADAIEETIYTISTMEK